MGRKPRAKPVTTPSAYIRGDLEINRLRSGIASLCGTCGAQPDDRCIRMRGPRPGELLYCHESRRRKGKEAADALVIARGRS